MKYVKLSYGRSNLLFLLWASLSVFLPAQASEEGPRETVIRVTDQVMAVVDEKGALMSERPEEFVDAVRSVLDPVVAFDYIAVGVMGGYAKQASAEQRERFTIAFQEGLVSTYAKGMAVYARLEVRTLPLEDEDAASRRASVTQVVSGEDGEHQVVYSMGKSKRDNQWKLLNVIIDGVNLGSTFRSQFAQSMKKYGDLDAVIENWAS